MDITGKIALSATQIAMLAGLGVLGLGAGGVAVWKASSPAGPPAAVAAQPTADEARLASRAAEEKARKLREAQKLRQADVGSGFRVDEQGELVAAAEGEGLPANRSLADVTGSSAEAAIGRGIREPRREGQPGPSAAFEAQAGVVHTNSYRPETDRESEPEEREQPSRAELAQSMLGYSTVKGAAWANRRPEKGKEDGQAAARKTGDEADPVVDRAMRLMERTAEAAPGGGGMAVAPTGMVQAGVAMLPSGPSRAGNDLMPAETSPQAFGVGALGDMRIGGEVGPTQIVREGKFLDCVLINELRVDLMESPVLAQVSRDFVSLDGQYVLVPAGTKLMGSAGRVQNLQQARVYLRFDRAIFPDQRSAYFPVRRLAAVDGAGAVGIEGSVDRHFLLTFGSAVMLGMLDGLAAAVEGPQGATPTTRELIMARTSMNMSQVVAGILQRYGNVVPTVTVEPGAKVKVIFASDVQMSPYMRTSELSWVRSGR